MKAPSEIGDRAVHTPMACMITRSGLSLDAAASRIRLALSLGIDFVQIRRHDLTVATLESWLRSLCQQTPELAGRLIVNTHWELAWSLGLAGVQLRRDSVPIARLRAHLRTLSKPERNARFLIGASRHSIAGLVEAYESGADFATLSVVFASESKPGVAPLGLELLAEASRAVPMPVLALGGVCSDRIRAISECGAGGLAGIGHFDNESSLRRLASEMQAWKLRLSNRAGRF